MRDAHTPEEALNVLLETIAMLQASLKNVNRRIAFLEHHVVKQEEELREQRAALLFFQHTLADGNDHTVH